MQKLIPVGESVRIVPDGPRKAIIRSIRVGPACCVDYLCEWWNESGDRLIREWFPAEAVEQNGFGAPLILLLPGETYDVHDVCATTGEYVNRQNQLAPEHAAAHSPDQITRQFVDALRGGAVTGAALHAVQRELRAAKEDRGEGVA